MFQFSEDRGKNIEDFDITKYESKWKNMSINDQIEPFQRADILQYSVDFRDATISWIKHVVEKLEFVPMIWNVPRLNLVIALLPSLNCVVRYVKKNIGKSQR